MPNPLFFQLEKEKRERILEAGMKEFAHQSYSEASTNQLVKAAGISKGSLFKYFANKEDLYFYLLDQVIADLMAGINEEMTSIKGDVFSVILRFAKVEFAWHLTHPESYELLKKAFNDQTSVLYPKILKRYNLRGESMYEQLLKSVDTKGLRWEKEKTLKILKWILEGFNQEFMKNHGEMEDVSLLQEHYTKELTTYLQMIQMGLEKNKKIQRLGGEDHV